MRVRYSFSSRRTGHIKNIKKQRQKFLDIAKKIIDESDIILEVLDARFEKEMHNEELIEKLKSNKKVLIRVLNKADLVQTFKPNSISCKLRKGVSKLRNKIKKEARKLKLNRKVTVGVLGYPNVGKSSVINILIGKSSAGTGAVAGFTKGIQKIKLDNKILLIDTPGVIPSSYYSMTDKNAMSVHAKLGARSYDKIKNPEIDACYLIQKFSNQIKKYFGAKSENPEDIIEEIGRKRNLIQKGNKVDVDRTSRIIIRDWQDGKIKI